MTPNQEPQPSDTSAGTLFEFVDEAHEVTDEERNRPRYGRPVPNPPQPKDSESQQDGGKA